MGSVVACAIVILVHIKLPPNILKILQCGPERAMVPLPLPEILVLILTIRYSTGSIICQIVAASGKTNSIETVFKAHLTCEL